MGLTITPKLIFLPALLFMTAYACGQDVHYNYDRGANFASYKTYQWVDMPSGSRTFPSALPTLPDAPPLPGAPIFLNGAADIRGGASGDQLIDQQIKVAIDEQLAQKGLRKVDKDADLKVSYQAAIHQEIGIDLMGTGLSGRSPGLWGADSIHGQTSMIPVGTLVVSLYDAGKTQLIWRGDASKAIELKRDPNKNYKSLQKAMAKLFKNYPPQLNK
jgi:hypothetical protein